MKKIFLLMMAILLINVSYAGQMGENTTMYKADGTKLCSKIADKLRNNAAALKQAQESGKIHLIRKEALGVTR